ncbi:hypothetical protein [Streptomyces sp. B3I8]|uniref:hypothetical protein n=1 Tax=Streptomyces sp. B3I8 TaxID=3042303 RepID=UPI0027845FF6|nr:hypothetical protein [Streptomyces sp. B3I8]MDQ0784562.1 hypothetical protein [Streptomyces sp. B3I8]
MSTQAFSGAYLLPLFHAIEQARADGAYRQLPDPDPASSLAADDAPLGPYAAAHLIRASYTAGLAHADALRRLTAAGEVDATSPWTLLRGALENFVTALWLLDGPAGLSAGAAHCRCGTRTCATASGMRRTPAPSRPATA